MEIDVTHHERTTDIDFAECYAEYWHNEQVLYFTVDMFGLDVAMARRVAEFVTLAAAELERHINSKTDSGRKVE